MDDVSPNIVMFRDPSLRNVPPPLMLRNVSVLSADGSQAKTPPFAMERLQNVGVPPKSDELKPVAAREVSASTSSVVPASSVMVGIVTTDGVEKRKFVAAAAVLRVIVAMKFVTEAIVSQWRFPSIEASIIHAEGSRTDSSFAVQYIYDRIGLAPGNTVLTFQVSLLPFWNHFVAELRSYSATPNVLPTGKVRWSDKSFPFLSNQYSSSI